MLKKALFVRVQIYVPIHDGIWTLIMMCKRKVHFKLGERNKATVEHARNRVVI